LFPNLFLSLCVNIYFFVLNILVFQPQPVSHKPLFYLLKRNSIFNFSEECIKEFEELKNKLIQTPLLTPPDFSKPFIIRTDASRDGLGGVLLQRDKNNLEVPIFYESGSLSKSEKNL